MPMFRGVLGCVLLFGVVLTGAAPSQVDARPVVVFTIDVESNVSFTLPEQIDRTCTDGSACGVNRILSELARRSWPATFFLNVYEQQRWGEEALRRLARRLQDGGHDVQLHTHPQWMYDPGRWAMHQYSLAEQTRIVADGVRLLEAWTGRSVVAHRAGAYTADGNTLIALERNGVKVDSSLFWRHENSRLDVLQLPRNIPASYGKVEQIPVTAYERAERAPLLGQMLGTSLVIRKIDPNWYVNREEVRDSIDALIAADVPVLVVFLHSFSFLGGRADDGVTVDAHALEMFRAILDHLDTKALPVVTMRDLAEHPSSRLSTSSADIVPRVAVTVSPIRYVWWQLKAAGPGRVAGGSLLLFLSGGFVALAMLRQRRRQRAVAADEAHGARGR